MFRCFRGVWGGGGQCSSVCSSTFLLHCEDDSSRRSTACMIVLVILTMEDGPLPKDHARSATMPETDAKFRFDSEPRRMSAECRPRRTHTSVSRDSTICCPKAKIFQDACAASSTQARCRRWLMASGIPGHIDFLYILYIYIHTYIYLFTGMQIRKDINPCMLTVALRRRISR